MGEVSFDFKDRIILITGSAGNIGRTTAHLFAKTGAKVVIVDKNQEGVKRVSNECKIISPFGYEPLEIVADLSVESELQRIMSTTIKRFDKLDVLVNLVGISVAHSIADETAVQLFDKTINLNLRSYYVLTHLAVPYLSKTSGSIVNVSSIMSSMTTPNDGTYSISKAGVDMMTKSTAIELGPMKIRVNSVNPGHIWPPLDIDKVPVNIANERKKWVENNYPLRRYGQPEDVAKVILFLCSDGAQFITGANIPVESGFGAIIFGV